MLTIAKDEIQDGEMRGYDVDGLLVLVAKVNGQVHAVKNRCTHLGCRLSEGTLEGLIVTCPCHGSKFDISNGKLVQSVSNWPWALQKAAALLMRDEEVFDVQETADTIEVSRKEPYT